MKFAIISDTHCKLEGLKLPEADVLLHCGDHTLHGTVDELEAAMVTLSGYLDRYDRIITIPGNHDDGIQKDEPYWINRCDDLGIDLLIDRALEIFDPAYNSQEGRIVIYGSPWQPFFHDYAYNFPNPAGDFAQQVRAAVTARDKWAEMPDDVDVLLTHGPPLSILDKTYGYWDTRTGCPALYDRVKRLPRLKLHAFGHLHESNGLRKLMSDHGDVTFVNAAICDRENYLPVQQAYVVDVKPTPAAVAA